MVLVCLFVNLGRCVGDCIIFSVGFILGKLGLKVGSVFFFLRKKDGKGFTVVFGFLVEEK